MLFGRVWDPVFFFIQFLFFPFVTTLLLTTCVSFFFFFLCFLFETPHLTSVFSSFFSCLSCCAVLSCLVVSDSVTLWTVARRAPLSMWILQVRILGCYALLQGIFPTQESNPGLLHCRRILYRQSHQGSLSLLPLL